MTPHVQALTLAPFVGQKEALRICRKILGRGMGKTRLREWARTVPGLHVKYGPGGRGYYVVAVLLRKLKSFK